MKLQALRQRDKDLMAQVAQAKRDRAAIGDAAVAENRALTDEERAKFVAAGQEIARLEALKGENDELLQAAEASNEADRNYRGPLAEDADRQVGATSAAAAGVRVEVGEDRAMKAPGFWGRQLLAMRKLALAAKGMDTATEADQRLVRPLMAAPTGLNTDVPSEGGYLVEQTRSNTILQRAYQVGTVLSRVRRMPIGPGSNGMKFPAIDETSRANSSRFGGIVSTWVGQASSVTAGKPKFREIDLKLRKIMATVYATDEQLVDAVALEGWVNTYLPLELQYRTEDAVVNGTGAVMPVGLMQSGALISVTRNTASRVLYEDVSGMWLRMWAPSRQNAVWFVEQSVEADLEQLAIPIGTGGTLAPIYRPAGSLPGQTYATLYGRPVIPVEYCAALGTAGDIVLTDLSEYVLIDKGGVEQAVSIHVAFLTDEQVWRFIYRVDGQLTWNSALTPKSGGNTLSCVVALT